MFLNRISTRFFHLTRLQLADKSALATLRKKTGYTFANCKKALEMHENDIGKAENWLKEQAQAMGWSKATKLEGRSTKQGLIGVLVQKNIGAILEVNCETDFVARNNTFRNFVQRASEACAKYVTSIESNNITKIALEGESLKKLTMDDGKMLSDELALMIGTVGENSTLRRAICYKTPDSIELCGFSHPVPEDSQTDGNFSFGKYGVIAAFSSSYNDANVQQIHRKICQHIIGMNPKRIGCQDTDKPNEVKDDEECLIFQEFVLDPEVTIGEMLEENNIKIIDFHRFECGETSELLEK